MKSEGRNIIHSLDEKTREMISVVAVSIFLQRVPTSSVILSTLRFSPSIKKSIDFLYNMLESTVIRIAVYKCLSKKIFRNW